MTVRSSGIAGSVRLKLADEVVALNFDNAVTQRLFQVDKERDEIQSKRIGYESARATWGTGQDNAHAEEAVEVW